MKTPIAPPRTSSDERSFSGQFDIARAMAKGTGWTVGTQLTIQGIAMLSTLILARLLVPADFGLVALATALSAALHVAALSWRRPASRLAVRPLACAAASRH